MTTGTGIAVSAGLLGVAAVVVACMWRRRPGAAVRGRAGGATAGDRIANAGGAGVANGADARTGVIARLAGRGCCCQGG